ncbi:MAG: DUF2336 domain-containing protein, partial [Alphaproteobacteria bacterium]|nr:DUF2336 domain-containing protein [Alphaproteobacteria bacterium]
MNKRSLSSDDVKRLLEAPSEGVRVETATKIYQAYGSDELDPKQRAIAEEIIRLLIADESVRVRQAIAEGLKECADLPHDMTLSLAKDLEDVVALPILSSSQILTNEDLIAIVESRAVTRQEAIAGRSSVNESVASALVAIGEQPVVVKLFQNEGADISAASFENAQARFPNADKLDEVILRRERVPLTIREKIIGALTDQFADILSSDVRVSSSLICDIVFRARDQLVTRLSEKSSDESVLDLVKSLDKQGRLTTQLLIRALCQGDITFFEAALAQLAKVPLMNARYLIHDQGGTGLKAIYQRAGLPDSYLWFFAKAMETCLELFESGEDFDHRDFRRKNIERFRTGDSEFKGDIESNDV